MTGFLVGMGMLEGRSISFYEMKNSGQKFFKQHEAQILDLCERYPVQRLYLFGSILTDRFDLKNSDVDVQVFFDRSGDPVELGAMIFGFWNELEEIFQRKVDLISVEPIRNPYLRKSIESTRQLVYERVHEEIFV